MASCKRLKTIKANIPDVSLNMLNRTQVRVWMSLWTRTLWHPISYKKGPGALLTQTRANNLVRVRVASLQAKSINLNSGKSIARTGKGNRTDAQKVTEKNQMFFNSKTKQNILTKSKYFLWSLKSLIKVSWSWFKRFPS